MNNKKRSKKQENRVAKEMNGRTTIASGSLYFQKGDVRLDKFLIECKTTYEDFYTLKRSTFEKIKREAIKDSLRIPLLQIDLMEGNERLVVLDYNDFLALNFDEKPYIKVEVETEKKSIRVKSLYEDEGIGLEEIQAKLTSKSLIYFRKDIIFKGKKDLHVVVLEWEDFLLLVREEE